MYKHDEYINNVLFIERKKAINGDYSVTFTTTTPIENEESIFIENDEYTVKQVEEMMIGETVCYHVYAKHIFFNLIDGYEYTKTSKTLSINEALSIIFKETSWTSVVVDSFKSVEFENYGDDTKLSLFNTILNRYSAEYEIDSSTKQVYLKKRCGSVTDLQFRYNHNIKTIKKNVDTSNLCTYIEGFGAVINEETGERLHVTYISPNSSVFGIRHAKPISDERFTDTNSLLEYIKTSLQDVPLINFEVEAVHTELQDYSLGDTIWVIYEPMKVDIQARILEITDYPGTNKTPKLTIGNFNLDSFVQATIDANKEAIDKFDDVFDNGKLKPGAYDKAVIVATEAINNSMTELEYPEGKGIIARDKNNSNNVVAFNSGGVGVSTDNGNLYKNAITARGIHGELLIGKSVKAESLEVSAVSEIREGLATTEQVTQVIADINGFKSTVENTYTTKSETIYSQQEAINTASNDATKKANEAKMAAEAYAKAKAESERILAEAYADGVVTEEEQARINAVNKAVIDAANDAKTKADEAKVAAETAANIATDNKLKSYSTTTQMNSAIDQKADEINLSVSSTYSTKAEFNNISIGGRNLLKKSNEFYAGIGASGITSSHDEDGILTINTQPNNGQWFTGFIKDKTGIEEKLNEGDEVTISFIVKADTNKPFNVYFKSGMGYYSFPDSEKLTQEFTTISMTVKWKKENEIDFHLGMSGDGGTYKIKAIKLEKGNKATDWTLAPEDTDDIISSLDTRISSAESKITEDAITNTVKKSFYTKDETEGTITSKGYQTSSQVQQKVDKVELKFSQSGGYNLIHNGSAFLDTLGWRLENPFGNKVWFSTRPAGDTWTGSTPCLQIVCQVEGSNDVFIDQSINTVKGRTYHVSGLFGGHNATKHIRVVNKANNKVIAISNSVGSNGLENGEGWARLSTTFVAEDDLTYIRLDVTGVYSNTSGHLWAKEVMVTEGVVQLPYSPHPNEISEGVTQISKDGIKVENSSAGSYTTMKADGFKIKRQSDNLELFSVGSNGRLLLQHANGYGTGIYNGYLYISHPDGYGNYLTENGISSMNTEDFNNASGFVNTHKDLYGRGTNGMNLGSATHISTTTRNDKIMFTPKTVKNWQTFSMDKNDSGQPLIASGYHNDYYVRLTFADPELWVTNRNGWAPVKASNFVNMSDRSGKKNIEEYEGNALSEINSTPIYKYHLEGDEDHDLKRVGVMLQEAPLDVIDPLGNGVDMYAMISMGWKAIQQLNGRIEELESEIHELRSGN